MSMIDDLTKQIFETFIHPKSEPSKTPNLDKFIKSGKNMERQVNVAPPKPANPVNDDVVHSTGDKTFDHQFRITSDIYGLVMLKAKAGGHTGGLWCGVDREEVNAVIDALISARDRVFPEVSK